MKLLRKKWKCNLSSNKIILMGIYKSPKWARRSSKQIGISSLAKSGNKWKIRRLSSSPIVVNRRAVIVLLWEKYSMVYKFPEDQIGRKPNPSKSWKNCKIKLTWPGEENLLTLKKLKMISPSLPTKRILKFGGSCGGWSREVKFWCKSSMAETLSFSTAKISSNMPRKLERANLCLSSTKAT